MDQSDQIFTQTCESIEIILHANASNAQRYEANKQLNQMLQSIVDSNNVVLCQAFKLAFKLVSCTNCDAATNEERIELQVYYGLSLLETILKYRWYQLDQHSKNSLLLWVRDCLQSRMFVDSSVPSSLSISKLVLSISSRLISELFIRTWPTEWPTFVEDLCLHPSLVSLYTLHNISYFLNVLHVPENGVRRKEITSRLINNHPAIYDYLFKCLQFQTNCGHVQWNNYSRLTGSKSLEVYESYLEWFPIVADYIYPLLKKSLQSDCDNSQLALHRCIRVIINRSNLKQEDSQFVENTFFHFSPDGFAHCWIEQVLAKSITMVSNETDEDQWERLNLVYEIATDIVVKCIGLYNQASTSPQLVASYEKVEIVWQTYIQSTIKLLEQACWMTQYDDSILKFLLQYSRFKRSERLEQSDGELLIRCPIVLNRQIDLHLLSLIACVRLQSLDETSFNQLSSNSACFEDYQAAMKQNRNKYLNFVAKFARHNERTCQEFIIDQLQRFLESRIQFSPQVLVNLSSTIIPKLDVDAQTCSVFENLFERLFVQLDNQSLWEEVRSNVLSLLSSMWRMFGSFKRELILALLTKLFDLTLASQACFGNNELRNHSGGLFIRLAMNCAENLLPYHDTMRAHVDGLLCSSLITSTQFCTLYDGFILLSNHFAPERQQAFLNEQIFAKLAWLTNYDGNLFAEFGLAHQPDPNVLELPLFVSDRFGNFNAAVTLLTTLLRRVEARRLRKIGGAALIELIKPVSRFVQCWHRLWRHHGQGDQSALAPCCHTFYAPYMFEQLPDVFLLALGVEQPMLMIHDRLKMQLASWDRCGPPAADLAGLHTQTRLWKLYLDCIQLLNYVNVHLLLDGYLEACATDQEECVNTLKTLVTSFVADLKYLPTIVMADVIRYYLNDLALYCPRVDHLVLGSELVPMLDLILRHLYPIMRNHLQLVISQRTLSLLESCPNAQSLFNLADPVSAKCSLDANRELCSDAIMAVLVNKFLALLQSILCNAKKLDSGKIAQTDASLTEMAEDGEHHQEVEMDQNDKTNNSNKSETANFLAKYFLMDETCGSLLVTIVGNALEWPVSGLKRNITRLNELLIETLIQLDRLQSLPGFFFFFERILTAFANVDRAEPEQTSRLLAMFVMLWDRVGVQGIQLRETIQAHFMHLWIEAGGQEKGGRETMKLLANGKIALKKRHGAARTLLESICTRGRSHEGGGGNVSLSSCHSMAKPVVHSLAGDADKHAGRDSGGSVAEEDADIFLSLSWLF